MIFPSNRVRIMVATKPIDFRKGHDSLAAMVKNELHKDPFTGTVFVFLAKKADRLKLLYWDGTELVPLADSDIACWATGLQLRRPSSPVSPAQIYSRQGVDLDRSTLADWVGRAAFELRPVFDALMADLKRSTKLFMPSRSFASQTPAG